MADGKKRAKADLFKVVDNVAVHGGPEVAQLTDVGHLTGTVVLTHVSGQCVAGIMVFLTDTTHQHVHIVHVHLQRHINTFTLYMCTGNDTSTRSHCSCTPASTHHVHIVMGETSKN